jgi:membrane protease subunit HflK
VPRARGEKQRLIEEANAFKEQEVLRATGEVERFLALLQAYRLAPNVTRERMHIEALEQILNHVTLTLIDEQAIGQQILPFLPLDNLNSTPGSLPSTEAPSTAEPPAQGGN